MRYQVTAYGWELTYKEKNTPKKKHWKQTSRTLFEDHKVASQVPTTATSKQ